jgi:hypothetical protein
VAKLAAPLIAVFLRRTADEAAVRLARCFTELAEPIG